MDEVMAATTHSGAGQWNADFGSHAFPRQMLPAYLRQVLVTLPGHVRKRCFSSCLVLALWLQPGVKTMWNRAPGRAGVPITSSRNKHMVQISLSLCSLLLANSIPFGAIVLYFMQPEHFCSVNKEWLSCGSNRATYLHLFLRTPPVLTECLISIVLFCEGVDKSSPYYLFFFFFSFSFLFSVWEWSQDLVTVWYLPTMHYVRELLYLHKLHLGSAFEQRHWES